MKLKTNFKNYFKQVIWITKDSRRHVKALSIILLLNVIYALSGVAIAVVSKILIDNAVKGSMVQVFVDAVVFGALIIITLGVGAVSSMVSVTAYESLCNSIRKRMFRQISQTEWISICKYHSGDVLTRLTSDIGNVASGVINTFPSIITLIVQLAAAFGTLLYYEPGLAFLAFVLGPFTIIFSRFWGRKLKNLHIKVQESESAYRSLIQESLQNLLILKTFRLEEQSVQKIDAIQKKRIEWVVKRNNTSVAASSVLGLGYWAGYFLAFCWGAVRLGKGATTFGTLTAFLQLVGQIQGPFIGLSRTLPQVIAAIASAARLMEIEGLPTEKGARKLLLPHAAGISYKGVSFSYMDTHTVLEKVTFFVKPGEIVGIVGASGEGKTTLIRILLALLAPSNGKVSMITEDGIEYAVSTETRDFISYVPQGNTLFSGTIAENVWCGDFKATLEELEESIRAACAWEFVGQFDEGINTVIGERGVGLSEGQAQRIAIARALLRKVPVLILDEATSSLDIDSEMRVLKGIRKMEPKRTCIVITHRSSALNICTRVLKLEDGRLVEISSSAHVAEDSASA